MFGNMEGKRVKFLIRFKEVFKICGYIILNHYADQEKILQSFMSHLTFIKYAKFRFENIFFRTKHTGSNYKMGFLNHSTRLTLLNRCTD